MEKIKQDQMQKILAVVGEEISGGFTAPKEGKITVKSMTVIPERDQIDSQGNITHINAWVKVDFNEGGSCSLRSLLISPNITWTKNIQEDRINALATTELEWQFLEAKVSKAGNPYKVAHVKAITL